MKKVIFGACLFFLSSMAMTNSSFGTHEISKIVIHDTNTRVFIYLKTPSVDTEQCEHNDFLVLDKARPLFDELYAAALSTFHAGGKVHGWVDGCDSTYGRPLLTRLDLIKE